MVNNQNKIRILHIITGSSIAGAENVVLTLAKGMKDSQFESEICTLSPEGELHKKAQQIGIKAYALGYKSILSLPKVVIKLFILLYKKNYYIINTHLSQAGVIGIIVGRLVRIPCIIETRHYSDYMYKYGNKIKQWLDKKTVNMTNHVIVVSNAGKEILKKIEGIKEEKINVIYNGIDISKFSSNHRTQIRKQLGIDNNIVLTFTATFHPSKGHKYLLESVGMLKKNYPNVVLLLIGDGVLRSNLGALTKQLNIEDNVRFLGYRTDIPDILSATDIYVHSSVEEGFGIAIIEAMAVGLPVVATNVGGIPEIITNGENGILVPPENPHALAEAIIDLIEHTEQRKILAEKGRQHVTANFTDEIMVKKYMEVYNNVINQGK
jgi:glycosyltransferase involved in cell wall biosynthesis